MISLGQIAARSISLRILAEVRPTVSRRCMNLEKTADAQLTVERIIKPGLPGKVDTSFLSAFGLLSTSKQTSGRTQKR